MRLQLPARPSPSAESPVISATLSPRPQLLPPVVASSARTKPRRRYGRAERIEELVKSRASAYAKIDVLFDYIGHLNGQLAQEGYVEPYVGVNPPSSASEAGRLD